MVSYGTAAQRVASMAKKVVTEKGKEAVTEKAQRVKKAVRRRRTGSATKHGDSVRKELNPLKELIKEKGKVILGGDTSSDSSSEGISVLKAVRRRKKKRDSNVPDCVVRVEENEKKVKEEGGPRSTLRTVMGILGFIGACGITAATIAVVYTGLKNGHGKTSVYFTFVLSLVSAIVLAKMILYCFTPRKNKKVLGSDVNSGSSGVKDGRDSASKAEEKSGNELNSVAPKKAGNAIFSPVSKVLTECPEKIKEGESKKPRSVLRKVVAGILVCGVISATIASYVCCFVEAGHGNAPIYCALVLIIAVSVALADQIVRHCGPKRDEDKTKLLDPLKREGLFLVMKFNGKMGVFFDAYKAAKKVAAKSIVPTKYLGFSSSGRITFKGVPVPDSTCKVQIVYSDEVRKDKGGGKQLILRMHLLDPKSLAILNGMRSCIGANLQDYLTLQTLKCDDPNVHHRYSARFKYMLNTRGANVRFAKCMALMGDKELLLDYLSSFMNKVSYVHGQEELSQRFLKTKEWRLMRFDEQRFGLLSSISLLCKEKLIEDQRKFLECLLKAYARNNGPANSGLFLSGTGVNDCTLSGGGESGPGFPFGSPRYCVTINSLAHKYGAQIDSDNKRNRAFVKQMHLGFTDAIFMNGDTVDVCYNYSEQYKDHCGTYLSDAEKERVCQKMAIHYGNVSPVL